MHERLENEYVQILIAVQNFVDVEVLGNTEFSNLVLYRLRKYFYEIKFI